MNDEARRLYESLPQSVREDLLETVAKSLSDQGVEVDSDELEEIAVEAVLEGFVATIPTEDMFEQIIQEEWDRHYDPLTKRVDGAAARESGIRRVGELTKLAYELRKTELGG